MPDPEQPTSDPQLATSPAAVNRRRTLVSKPALRRLFLDVAAEHRAHRFTRVDPELFEQAERNLLAFVRRVVDAQPSAGKTIRSVPTAI